MNRKIKIQRFQDGKRPRAAALILDHNGEITAVFLKRTPGSSWVFWIYGVSYTAPTLRAAIAQRRLLTWKRISLFIDA